MVISRGAALYYLECKFSAKISRHAKEIKIWPQTGQKQPMGTVSEEAQTLYLLDKDLNQLFQLCSKN